ncbi:MAG: hypothetical protein MZV65_16715 [Chromatiales bacterium]|nr:hypothetical protein [Chromatiales bacterium]
MTARTTTYVDHHPAAFRLHLGDPIDRPDGKLDISLIRIDPIARQADGGADAVSRCSGFILSEKEVRTFLVHAARFRDDGSGKYTRILPCSAGGSAVINGRKYRWVIRTGGVGELVSGADRFITICGKGCCDKVPGIC